MVGEIHSTWKASTIYRAYLHPVLKLETFDAILSRRRPSSHRSRLSNFCPLNNEGCCGGESSEKIWSFSNMLWSQMNQAVIPWFWKSYWWNTVAVTDIIYFCYSRAWKPNSWKQVPHFSKLYLKHRAKKDGPCSKELCNSSERNAAAYKCLMICPAALLLVTLLVWLCSILFTLETSIPCNNKTKWCNYNWTYSLSSDHLRSSLGFPLNHQLSAWAYPENQCLAVVTVENLAIHQGWSPERDLNHFRWQILTDIAYIWEVLIWIGTYSTA